MAGLKKTTSNWLAGSGYDIKSAQHMFNTGRHLYVIFLCHLAIEKLLKAVFAQTHEKHPPYTHDLYKLIGLIALDIPPEHQPIIAKLNELSIATRYPEDLRAMVKEFPKRVTKKYLEQSKAFLQWLRQDPRLSPS